MASQKPWAVLVCRFSDDRDPAEVLVRDLPKLEAPNAASDPRTVLELFRQFFTSDGNAGFNAVRYFNEMSHGNIDLNGSQVFVVQLELTQAQAVLAEPYTPAQGAAYQVMITEAAQQAALQQGVPLQNFYGIVITSHALLSMAQGGPIPGGGIVPNLVGWAGLDYRWVRNNGVQAWGQEMGHGFGLDHSRSEGVLDESGQPEDYTDLWDIMSTRRSRSGLDPEYGFRGPGLNAWNMRSRGWLDETRVWHCPAGSFEQQLELRPLHRKDLPGFLAAELPPLADTGGFPRFLVEYRKPERWDSGQPRSVVSVHRFEGPIGQFLGTHSYVMRGTKGQFELLAGDRFASTARGPSATVLSIDDLSGTVTIRLGYLNGVIEPPAVGANADGRLQVFALADNRAIWSESQAGPNAGWTRDWRSLDGVDVRGTPSVAQNADRRLELFVFGGNGGIWHKWQTAPNGGWTPEWYTLGGVDLRGTPSVAQNADGRLELFVLGGNGGIWHKWQTAPNGGWTPEWYSLGGVDVRGTPSVGRNADGRLELFVLGGNGGIWHKWQTAPNGGWTPEWYSLGGVDVRGTPSVAQNADGRLELFVLGGNGGIWHKWQTAPNGGWTPEWYSLGGVDVRGTPSVGRNADGRLELFVLGGNGGIWHKWQTAPNGGWTPEWYSLGGVDVRGTPSVAQNADGRLELFVLGGNAGTWHKWQTAPNGGWIAEWSSLDG